MRRQSAAPPAASRELDAVSRLAAIVESSDDAMIGKTLDGVITTWNSGAERMYGYTASEIVGRNVSMLIPSDRPDELPAMLRRLARGERIDHFETERTRKSGVAFDVSVTISPIRDRAGTIVGASTVTRDITDRKRAEADLRDLQERLHQAQRLESVGQLAGRIAHDFNNLLAGIMNYSALVTDGLEELTNRLGIRSDATVVTLTEDVAEITNVTARAARLTHQLLIFSRNEVVKAEILDVNTVVIDIEKLLRQTLGATIELETELADDLPRTKGDRGHVEQILMNLAVNARDAMTNGGRLGIRTTRYEADDDYARKYGIARGNYARLTVSDTGCGMSREVAARAFEPFYTTKATGEGTGLGLATVYGIVTRAGGTVVISSRPELGTSVDVMLPATNDIPPATPAATSARPPVSRSRTILLVEDEEMVREPTRRILISAGYTVLAASSAEEALRIAGNHSAKIDLLLTDVVMPGRSGKALATDLTRSRPQTRVLYMSGYASDLIGFGTAAEQDLNLIAKPFAPAGLLRSVHEALDDV